MSEDAQEDATTYKVVVSCEEQYSMWPSHRECPVGWTDAGMVGLKSECLDWIKELERNMRPVSLRKPMEGTADDV